jgi:hypothetical protein
MFDADTYLKRPKKKPELLGLEKEDFSNLIDDLHKDGIVNNVHYDIQSGEQITVGNSDGILRVKFINKK